MKDHVCNADSARVAEDCTCTPEAKEGMPFVEGGVSRYSTKCSAAVRCML